MGRESQRADVHRGREPPTLRVSPSLSSRLILEYLTRGHEYTMQRRDDTYGQTYGVDLGKSAGMAE